jgi:hypothetical protein
MLPDEMFIDSGERIPPFTIYKIKHTFHVLYLNFEFANNVHGFLPSLFFKMHMVMLTIITSLCVCIFYGRKGKKY